MKSVSKGAYLLTLESELGASVEAVETAILVQGLFSRQVCLTEFQGYDNWGVIEFFKKNELGLFRMLNELGEDEVPLIGTCNRFGANWDTTLNFRLQPTIGQGFPTYVSMLSPEKNTELRMGWSTLKTENERRQRFFNVAGHLVEQHIQRLNHYFGNCPDKTIVAGGGSPQEKLYGAVAKEIGQLENSCATFTEMDKEVRHDILERINQYRQGEKQSREQLHWALYRGEPAPMHGGVIKPKKGAPTHIEEARHEWRYLIDSVYNYNLAENLGLRPALNSDWFRIPRLVRPTVIPPCHDTGGRVSIELPTSVHAQYLDLEFLVKVRKEPNFFKHIEEMHEARANGNQSLLRRSFIEHLDLISHAFAKHLVSTKGRPDLVDRTVAEVWSPAFEVIATNAGTVAGLLALWMGQPADTAWDVVKYGEVAGGAFVAVKYFFGGRVKVRTRKFKNFIHDVGHASGADKI